MFALYVQGKFASVLNMTYNKPELDKHFIYRPNNDKEATKPVFSSGGALQVS